MFSQTYITTFLKATPEQLLKCCKDGKTRALTNVYFNRFYDLANTINETAVHKKMLCDYYTVSK